MIDVWQQVANVLGAAIVERSTLHGGDINEAFRVELDDGRTVFVKVNQSAPPDMFGVEARGLAWLAEAGGLRVPAVIAHGDNFLALEHLDSRPRVGGFDERLGEGLAVVHAAGAEHVGLSYDNYLATLTQANQPAANWAEFYARRRLEPLVHRAIDRGVAPPSWIADFEALYARLPELVGDDEAPARLHGDLWSGNVHVDERGQPCLIDPAVYGGHREVDLAMLSLFGNPGPSFFAAYESVRPLAPGWRERVPLYQLYPLLAHVNLFGRSYAGQTERALRRYM